MLDPTAIWDISSSSNDLCLGQRQDQERSMKHMVEERVQQDAWQGALGMGQVGQVTYEITIVGGNKNNQRFIYLPFGYQGFDP